MIQLVVFLFAALLTASLMWPSEGALRGDGLHLAFGWLITAAVAAVAFRRSPKEADRSRSAETAAFSIVLLVAGFWLSTWHVFQVRGDRRAALNLALEWSAIAAIWWTARQLVQHAHGRQWIPALLVGLTVGTAVVGVAQHHVTYPRQAQWYQQQRSKLDGTQTDAGLPGGVDRISAAKEFQRLDIPLHGAARQLFERRLLDSSEPTGPFALANTLGGLLAIALVLVIGSVLRHVYDQTGMHIWTWLTVAGIGGTIGYCLLLTKSRTAWVGLAAGIALLLVRATATAQIKRLKWPLLAGLTILCTLLAVGIGTGAIDREVVLESPRSLQFRLFYWMGASGVIAEEPVFGAGPGNFRQLYLKHKVVESSEEILDPHNIVLDAWCSAGLLGMSGLCLLAVSGFSIKPGRLEQWTAAAGLSLRQHHRPVLAGAVGGLLLHVGWRWFTGGEIVDSSAQDLFDSVNLVLLIPVAGLAGFAVLRRKLAVSSVTIQAALACLLIHLLGAGGLQISVLGLLLLVLHALGGRSSPESKTAGEGSQRASRPAHSSGLRRWHSIGISGGMAAGLWLLAAAATLWVGAIPVQLANQQASLAASLRVRGNLRAAEQAWTRATSADPLNTDSRQRRMELLTYQYLETEKLSARADEVTGDMRDAPDQRFAAAVRACDELIEADRRATIGYYFRSRLYDQRQQRRVLGSATTSSPVPAQDSNLIPEEHRALVAGLSNDQYHAWRDLRHVVAGYPTNARFLFDFADLNSRYGVDNEARRMAKAALAVDQVNHNWGHADRYLATDQLERLQEIMAAR